MSHNDIGSPSKLNLGEKNHKILLITDMVNCSPCSPLSNGYCEICLEHIFHKATEAQRWEFSVRTYIYK